MCRRRWEDRLATGDRWRSVPPNPDGNPGPRKDTVIVLPMQKLEVALNADDPGIWMLHCHNTYHQEAGMMTSLSYAT